MDSLKRWYGESYVAAGVEDDGVLHLGVVGPYSAAGVELTKDEAENLLEYLSGMVRSMKGD